MYIVLFHFINLFTLALVQYAHLQCFCDRYSLGRYPVFQQGCLMPVVLSVLDSGPCSKGLVSCPDLGSFTPRSDPPDFLSNAEVYPYAKFADT